MYTCSDKNCNCVIFHKDKLDKVKKDLISDDELLELVNIVKLINTTNKIKILEAIKEEELCVCDIGHLIGLTKSAISHQMKQFKKYDLLSERKEGKMVYYKLKNNNISNLINKVRVINEKNY